MQVGLYHLCKLRAACSLCVVNGQISAYFHGPSWPTCILACLKSMYTATTKHPIIVKIKAPSMENCVMVVGGGVKAEATNHKAPTSHEI